MYLFINEMGRACIAYGGRERGVQGFAGETWGKEDQWGEPGVDGRIILGWIFGKWDVGVDWVELA
jgi:hypothetical protein